MKMLMMTTPEGVESTRGDSGSDSPFRTPSEGSHLALYFLFSISASVCFEITLGTLLIEGFSSR
jgi:hypothetical protein